MTNSERDQPEPAPGSGVADYYLGMCLIALIVLAWEINQLVSGANYLPALPFVLGLVLLWLRLPTGPPLFLLLVTVLSFRLGGRDESFFETLQPGAALPLVHRLITSAAVLAFVVGYYRRLAIESSIFPLDKRKAPAAESGGKLVARPALRRDLRLAGVGEFYAAVLAVPACCVGAFLVWQMLNRIPPPESLELDPASGEWRLLLLLGILAASGALCLIGLEYFNRALATPMQSLLFLQDQLWRETRREQGRVNRWLVRTRLRAQRKKEKT